MSTRKFGKKVCRYYRARAAQVGGYAVEHLQKMQRARIYKDDYEAMAMAWARLAIYYANASLEQR